MKTYNIKAIILDVDGVIVGTKKGYNLPHPPRHICSALQKVHDSGITVSLLSAKAYSVVSETVRFMQLNNLHIADGGSVIFNPFSDGIKYKHELPQSVVEKIAVFALQNNLHTSFFSLDNYFVLENYNADLSIKYEEIMSKKPIVSSVEDLLRNPIMRITIITRSSEEKSAVERAISTYDMDISTAWASHPHFLPAEVMILTPQGISKKSGLDHLLKFMKIDSQDVLGVGDTIQDWDFIANCGYKATLENATDELKGKFNFNDPKQFIGGHVDNDGILDIINHFELNS